jgi:anti-sigma regulatory factor (Ser/Thr protein kinase)
MNRPSIRFNKGGLDDLAEIREFIEKYAAKFGCSEDSTAELTLAVNEAATNVFEHGYHLQPGYIEVSMEEEGDSMVVRIYDKAGPFDPNSAPPPKTSLPLEVRMPGGMGVHIMKSFTDELEYERTDDGCNVLRLIKHKGVH